MRDQEDTEKTGHSSDKIKFYYRIPVKKLDAIKMLK